MTTTEIVNLEMKEIQVHYGPELPWEFKEHCHVKINDSYSMLTGGRDFPLRTLFGYRDLAEFAVKPGPNMRYPRYQHACAHIKHKNGSNYIIVAGGHLPQEAGIEEHADDSTDIFDLDKNIWYQGKIYMNSMYLRYRFWQNFNNHDITTISEFLSWSAQAILTDQLKQILIFLGPQISNAKDFGCYGASMVTMKSGLEAVLVGCENFKQSGFGYTGSNMIYKLKWDGNQLKFVEVPEYLWISRTESVAMFIDDSMANCTTTCK